MDKEKSVAPHSGGLPPPSGRCTGSSFHSGGLPPPNSDAKRFSQDISQMPDNPPKNLGHRRAHSEILTLPDDLSFDTDLGVVSVAADGDGPSFSDETDEDLLYMYLDMDKFNSSSAMSSSQMGEPSEPVWRNELGSSSNLQSSSSERPRIRHQHSQSMDGSTSIKPEMLGNEEVSGVESKKAISAAKLSELALIDPKRAKRIWANRQSAARSKERKMRYIAELERKVQTLQTEATTLSAQLSLLQRDTNGLSVDNNELKLRVQTMEQQVHLQDALNESMKEEVQHLKVLTGQGVSNGASMMKYGSLGPNQQFYPNNQSMHTNLAAQQFQQLQIRSQKQQQQQLQQQYQYRQQLYQQRIQQQEQQNELRRPRSSSGQKESMTSPDLEASSTKD